MIKPKHQTYSKKGECQKCGKEMEMKTSTQKYCKKCAIAKNKYVKKKTTK